MGFFDSLGKSAGSTLGSNLMGGHKVQVKNVVDAKGEAKAAEARANAQIKQAEAQAKLEAKQNVLETVNAIRFDGTADEIGENLNTLLSMYKQLGESAGSAIGGTFSSALSMSGMGGIGGAFKSDTDKLREAITEKAEYGILKLRKLDEETAAFFQKKFDALKPVEQPAPEVKLPGFMKGFMKK